MITPTSRIRSRLLREQQARREDAEAAVEFAVLLLEALEVPEVRAAIVRAAGPSPRRPEPPGRRAAPMARGRR